MTVNCSLITCRAVLSRIVKSPPLKALSLFTSIPEENIHYTQQSVSLIFFHLLSYSMLAHAESLVLDFISGKIKSPLFTLSSLLSYLTRDGEKCNGAAALVYEVIINAHLKARLHVERACEMFDEMIARGLVPKSNTLNALLKFFVESDDLGRAWWFFEKNKGRVGMDAYTFGILIKGSCANGDLERGFKALDVMRDMGLIPNVVVYTTLIDGCCKKGEVERGKQLFYEMEGMGLVPNQYTYTVLINGFFRTGLKEDGFELYEKMKSTGSLPDLHTYNSVLNVYCRAGEMGKAFRLFDEMRSAGVTCNVVTYNILIEGFCRKRRVREAYKLMDEMERDGLAPSIITYNTLIDAYCRAGMLNKSLHLFDVLKSVGLSPTVVTYNVLIAGCSRTENPSRVLDFVRDMEERGISPSKVTYTILIDCFARNNDMDKAIQILSCMKSANIVPDVHTYGVLINGWCNLRNMKEASKLFKNMGEPNDVIYNTMILGYNREGSSYKALKLLREMREKEMRPNAASYNMTIQVLWGDGKLEEAEELLCDVIKSGIRPSNFIFDKPNWLILK